MCSARLLDTDDQVLALFVPDPPGSLELSAQFWGIDDQVQALSVSASPGLLELCAHFFYNVGHVFERLESLSLKSGGNPDCAKSLALSLYPPASFALQCASDAGVRAATEWPKAAEAEFPAERTEQDYYWDLNIDQLLRYN